jgi:sugar lactone lactonase YvrE
VYGFLVSYPLNGVTVAGYGNGSSGRANNALNSPWGLALDGNDILYVADQQNSRVMKFQSGSLNGSIVAGTGMYGNNVNQLQQPAEISINVASSIYVNDYSNYRVMLWRNNSSSGVMVAGTGVAGSSLSTIGQSYGLSVDSHANIYVSDQSNHRVMKWAVNVSSGIVVAGTSGSSGGNNQMLNNPYGLDLDENSSYLYIADTANHRIQRWSPGATSGVTIIGITGASGTNATMLNSPSNVALSINETFLYVSDFGNNRVQRFVLT